MTITAGCLYLKYYIIQLILLLLLMEKTQENIFSPIFKK